MTDGPRRARRWLSPVRVAWRDDAGFVIDEAEIVFRGVSRMPGHPERVTPRTHRSAYHHEERCQ